MQEADGAGAVESTNSKKTARGKSKAAAIRGKNYRTAPISRLMFQLRAGDCTLLLHSLLLGRLIIIIIMKRVPSVKVSRWWARRCHYNSRHIRELDLITRDTRPLLNSSLGVVFLAAQTCLGTPDFGETVQTGVWRCPRDPNFPRTRSLTMARKAGTKSKAYL